MYLLAREPRQKNLYIRDNPTYEACHDDDETSVVSSQDCIKDGETKQAIIQLQLY